jgi:hypothetical protein
MDGRIRDWPQLFSAGRRLSSGCLAADPSLTIIEVQDQTGLLLAESCYEDSLSQFHLEKVIWIRGAGSLWQFEEPRSFADVVLYRHETDVFVAQDGQSKKLLPHPSCQPYVVAFLSEEEYRALKSEIEEPIGLPDLAQRKIQELPGFSCDECSVTAPEGYAVAELGSLQMEILDSE